MMEARRPPLRIARRCALVTLLLGALLPTLVRPAHAGDLAFWESSSLPGVPLALAPPVTETVLDIDYSPISAEGGGLYGLSEVLVYATGDLTLTTTGFGCHLYGCLSAPFPFVDGPSVLMSGADNLPGEFTSSQDLVTVAVSGTHGYVAVVKGRYLDATGVVQSLGTVQDIDAHIIAEVPEPGLPAALALGGLTAAAAARRRRGRVAPSVGDSPPR